MSTPIPADTRIGHVHLKVADLERSLAFYCGVLGFTLMQRFGTQAAFISAGGYHHHIGLNTWESLGGSPPPPGSTGLFHTAILYPERKDLADALKRLHAAGIPLDGEPTTESAKPSISAIRIRMASSSTGTDRRTSGPWTRTADCRCSRGRWIWVRCWRLGRRIRRS